MSVERNKATVRRVFDEGFSQGLLEVIDECVAPGAVDRHEFTDEAPDFNSHLKGVITMLRASLPDLEVRVDDIVGEGDRVAVRTVLSGTHTGAPFFGIEAGGNRVQVEQFHFVRCDDDGRGVEHWAAIGDDEMLRQLRAAHARA